MKRISVQVMNKRHTPAKRKTPVKTPVRANGVRRREGKGLALMFLLLLPSCVSQPLTEVTAPIADSTMVQLIIELHLAEARAQVSQSDQTASRDSIFFHYGVEKDDFEAAMDYYAGNPDAYVRIYSEALDKLSDERYFPAN